MGVIGYIDNPNKNAENSPLIVIIPNEYFNESTRDIDSITRNQKINITGKYRLGDIRHNYADLTQAKKILGFYPKYNFVHGLENFTNWVKKQKIEKDMYKSSEKELKNKGLLK